MQHIELAIVVSFWAESDTRLASETTSFTPAYDSWQFMSHKIPCPTALRVNIIWTGVTEPLDDVSETEISKYR